MIISNFFKLILLISLTVVLSCVDKISIKYDLFKLTDSKLVITKKNVKKEEIYDNYYRTDL